MPDQEILVVDDNADMVEAMSLVLEDAGYEVRRAANGREALEAVASRAPSLILLDMIMPVMDGWQCARELRTRYGYHIPIVVITAAEHARACSDGIDAEHVLAKPFHIHELLRIVARCMRAGEIAGSK